METKSPEAPNRPSAKVNDPVSRPTVGMVRHCGPMSWIPRNSGLPIVRCPIARAVVGTRPRCVTVAMLVHRTWVIAVRFKPTKIITYTMLCMTLKSLTVGLFIETFLVFLRRYV